MVTVTEPASQVSPGMALPAESRPELRERAKLPEPDARALNSIVSTTPEPLDPGRGDRRLDRAVGEQRSGRDADVLKLGGRIGEVEGDAIEVVHLVRPQLEDQGGGRGGGTAREVEAVRRGSRLRREDDPGGFQDGEVMADEGERHG